MEDTLSVPTASEPLTGVNPLEEKLKDYAAITLEQLRPIDELKDLLKKDGADVNVR